MLHTLLLLLQCSKLASSTGESQWPRRESFYVGGEYTNLTIGNMTAQYMINQIYVEKLIPAEQTQSYPLVLIHGSGQTGTNFLHTPDGREGWASYFLSKGYTVYLSDQPSRGRSPWNPSIGTMSASDTTQVEKLFTAISSYSLWPQAKLHTQWPGTGKVGDPTFDAFYAAQVQTQANAQISEAQNAKAYTALLDRIGEAHVITHSQAGPYGWRIGDLRPHLVKSIVALEPGGPPFISRIIASGPARPFGLTELEIKYEPSAGPNATQLQTVVVSATEANHADCIMQAEPAKKLTNLAQVPVLVVTSQAGYHSVYDDCTVKYLRQAGVTTEHMELGKEGVHGNGHMFFMEKNNLVIAEKVLTWLQSGLRRRKNLSLAAVKTCSTARREDRQLGLCQRKVFVE